MLVNSNEALGRLHSTDNLMNRLKTRRDAMGLFGVGSAQQAAHTNLPVPTKVEPLPVPFSNPFEKPAATAIATKASPAEVATENKEPGLEALVNDSDTQIKLATAHNEALSTLVDSIKEVKLRLPEIKADRLPGVISATAKVVDQIQRQRMDANKGRGDQTVHLHFYTPVQKPREEYEVIDVG